MAKFDPPKCSATLPTHSSVPARGARAKCRPMNHVPTAQRSAKPGKNGSGPSSPPAHLGWLADFHRCPANDWHSPMGQHPAPLKLFKVVSFRRRRCVGVVRQQMCCMREFAHSTYD